MADMEKVKDFFIFKKIGEKDKKNEPELMTTSTGKYEISLLPEVKLEMIRKQKVRNLVMFVTIIVVSVSLGAVAILGSVKIGQDITLSGQNAKLEELSAKITSDTQLTDILTIQDQLNKISKIEDNKKVLSRVFSLLTVFLPSGADKISLSELNIDLETTTLNFNAQADAGTEPLIDYRVLESFKKSVALMKYDYGRYVTANGSEIPTICIEETGEDGNIYMDEKSGGIFAKWRRNWTTCLPDGKDNLTKDELANYEKLLREKTVANKKLSESERKTEDDLENEALEEVVKGLDSKDIWRTPQFESWYKDNKMSLDGSINNVEHFESECIAYSGVGGSDSKITWSAENSCDLAPDGVTVSDSANARDASNNLVLRFSAATTIDSGFFAYNNKHVMGIGPFGQNVTDSYVQTENIFVAPARECEYGDNDCLNNTKNSTGE